MDAQPASTTRWVLSDASQRLLRKPVNDGCVIFDTLTGQTQLLSPLGHFLLEFLASRMASASTGELLRVALNEDGANNGEGESAATSGEVASIQETLQALAQAGLLITTP